MKNFKFLTTFFAAALTLLVVNTSMAQVHLDDFKKSTPEQRAQFQTDLMKSKLNLDAGQTAKAQVINLKYAQKMQPIVTGNDNRMSKLRQAMALQKLKDGELQGVFTAEQFKKYQGFEQEMKSKMMAKAKDSN